MKIDVIDFTAFYSALTGTNIAPWKQDIPPILEQVFAERQHGDWDKWQATFQQLPRIQATSIELDKSKVMIGAETDCDDETRIHLEQCLKQFHPWRKGPYQLFGIHIDTEWHSDWKWDRLASHIAPLKNRCVLDVGCGNGYHMWRMRAAGARLVVGADPSLFFLMQFNTIKAYRGADSVYLLPLKSEDLPPFQNQTKGFDTVFSMGVFYHRRSPIEHLLELKRCLRSGGELVLETLVVDGDENTLLMPEDRYAQMNNVWFLPSTQLLERMLRKVGFVNVRTVDVCRTTTEEQRSTEWMQWDSLSDFIDSQNPELSIEGYQAPTRAIVIANRR
jgi:tRNA (mo5U34)-methyltransferase